MSARPWYKRYGADFIAGTLGLSLEEKGAYSLILDLIYDRGGPIPDDPRYIAGVCGCTVRRWNAIRAALIDRGKIYARDGQIGNSRADFELENSEKIHEKRVENGAKGGKKRAENEAEAKENKDLGQAGLKHRARQESREDTDPSQELRSFEGERATRAERAKPTRGSRIDPDWQPSEIDRAYAERHGLSPAEIGREAEKFRNYFAAKTGENARKADWPATWRNWILKAIEQKATGPPAAQNRMFSTAGGTSNGKSSVVEACRKIRAEWESSGVAERANGAGEPDLLLVGGRDYHVGVSEKRFRGR